MPSRRLATACVLGVLVLSATAEAAFTFKQQMIEVAERRSDGEWDVITSYKYSIKATATAADLRGALGAVGAKTPFTVDCGDFRYNAVPSDDPNWTSGKTEATVVKMGLDSRDRAAAAFAMSFAWGPDQLTVGVKSGPGADELIYWSRSKAATTISATLNCRIGVGGVEKAFPVQVSGRAGSRLVTKGAGEEEEEFELEFLDVVGASA